jgi:Kef-type K+ transport system membrane component KefB
MVSVHRRRTWVLIGVLASVFGVMALGGAVGVVWWWGVGFDEAEALGMATASTNRAMVASVLVAVAGAAGLAATGALAAAVASRQGPARHDEMLVIRG